MLYLLSEGAHILEFTLGWPKAPLVRGHGIGQGSKVMLNVLPDEFNRIWNGFGLRRTLLRMRRG
jgi:hypothetical protein